MGATGAAHWGQINLPDNRLLSGRLIHNEDRRPARNPRRPVRDSYMLSGRSIGTGVVMAATVTKLETRRSGTSNAGGPTLRAAIDAFLDTPKIKGNPNTQRAYAGVLDRT